ncbi:MAG: sensor histidine kinase [Brevibacterium aurantiacum]|uniref:histidine kinase n=1 Tax=Brevibacterium aurantiacum TaxID=273384 RepID=A0A1D7W7H4_BREAU|nr:HAMP domain-containing sensor histidine kinase [Brevibacterium aurantiacum]MDN5594890.1 HAMP domain-containing histidine kinase [Brevibacterium sp.]AOP54932.1 Two-component system response phosphate sensor kinase, PhoR [Brevibacterium aurantiacum]AZL10409.1 sensor histidine kinase [Brevibacterium aurantiacum]AZL14093.1 sensor histidine kinase [Brevibacterium aurantiacum]MDN5609188.1 HAMP domain-containing histidine kinase [Brevibacterium sp.]
MAKESRPTRPGFWEEWSLTTKLLAIMMLLMLLVLSGTSAWVLENLRDSLVERTDERLINASETLAKQAYQDVFQPAQLQSSSSSDKNESADSDGSDGSDSSTETPTTIDSSSWDELKTLMPGGFYVQFYDTDGKPLSDPVAPEPGNSPVLPKINESKVYAQGGEPFTVPGTTSQWRARAMKVQNTDVLVSIAVPFDREIDNINERARNTMIGIGLLALAMVAGVGYWAINNTFRPLRDIETTASRIAAGDLSQRVPTFPRNTELGRLSGALNTMLGRIEDSFDGQTRSEKRIRQFVSDASHELRTPLVTIRGYAELYRQGAITKSDDIGNAMERMESEAKRMGVLVDDLVVLARLDEQRPAEIGPVDLHRIARDAAADAAAQAPDRDISFIGLDGEDAQPVPMIRGSESKIRQVVVNLAGNAVRHTPEHTAIEFAVGVVGGRAEASAESAEASNGQDTESKTGANKTGANKAAAKDKSRERGFVTGGVRIFRRGDSNGNDQNDAQAPAGIVPDMTAAGSITVDDSLRGFPNGRVRIEVRDHGDGIDPEVVPRIFERFYRLDVSRTRDTGGSGLGLSIVKAIVENHHGAISVHQTPGGGATFRIDLPISETEDSAPDARKDER